MSVTVQCFHCNAILDLDDGFRGGVCRCSNCGSLLQVPPGDDAPPSAARRVRPARPPSPMTPAIPVQNATSSKLDVGLLCGQFDSPPSPQIRRDLDLSSGLTSGRVHPTTPIAAPPSVPARGKRRRSTTPSPEPPPSASAPSVSIPSATSSTAPSNSSAAATRSRAVFWLVVLLIIVTLAVVASLIIYYLYFYEPSLAPGLPGR